jgi:type III pantothenate kinase
MLAVDIGNTRIKTAHFDAGGNCLSRKVYGHDETAAVQAEMRALGGGLVSNVSALPDSDFLLPGYRLLSHALPLPLEIDYDTRETLGSDRLALACGAAFLYPGQHLLVISAGTCITYDLIESGRIYRGGAISPGLMMRFRSLKHFTGRLPEIAPAENFTFPGKSTEASIRAGVQGGLQAEVSQRIEETAGQFNDLVALITGGDAGWLSLSPQKKIFAAPDLLLFGLFQIDTHHAI